MSPSATSTHGCIIRVDFPRSPLPDPVIRAVGAGTERRNWQRLLFNFCFVGVERFKDTVFLTIKHLLLNINTRGLCTPKKPQHVWCICSYTKSRGSSLVYRATIPRVECLIANLLLLLLFFTGQTQSSGFGSITLPQSAVGTTCMCMMEIQFTLPYWRLLGKFPLVRI